MKRSMKLLAYVLCFIMVLGLFPVVRADEAPALATADEIVVYYTNDVHTYIDAELSYDNLADLKDKTAEVAKGVLLLDAGDHIQGTAYGSMDKGETIIELMNAAGYDAATMGNHEFDYGMERALELTQQMAQFPYLSANFYHEQDGVPGEPVHKSYEVFDFDDTKIAVVGVTTPESFTKSTPAYFQDEEGNYIYGIAGGEDGAELYAAVQTAIDAASAEADYVIGLGHLGNDASSQPWTSAELIANTTGLDAFIDGHSHTTMECSEVEDKAGNKVILTQTGEYFEAIGRMSITAEGITTSLITEYAGSDAAVKAVKDEWMTAIDTQLGEVIGYTDIVFDNYDETGRLVRKQETNTGNFCADALYSLFDNMELDVDVAIMNGGGVRNNAVTGELSYKSFKQIHTFGNVACLITVTGQQILDALEWGAKNVGASENGGFLQVSGLYYDVDLNVPSTVQADEKNIWTGGPTGEYRVKNVHVYRNETWEPLELDAEYNLAGYNYTLRDLGDGFAMFDGAKAVLDYVMEDYMVLAEYVKTFEKNEDGLYEIPADDSRYASVYGEGRILNVGFTDIDADDYYFDSVRWAQMAGVTLGATRWEFWPEDTVTRAEAVAFLYRFTEETVPEVDLPFTDVPEDAWYGDALAWAYDSGVTNGTTATTFDPNRECTRAELLTMLWRAVGEPAPEGGNPFSDVPSRAYYCDAVLWANEYGITNGMSTTTFGPHMKSQRAHAVTFLYRLYLALDENAG